MGKQLKILKQQINSFENQEIVWKLQQLQQKQFEGANMPGKFLAHQSKKRKENGLINKITVEGKELMEAGEIKKALKKLYAKLYQEKKVEDEDIETYLGKVENKEISDSQREILNRPIDEEEIKEAINATKLGKAPGLDGYMAKFYRRFKEELAVQLLPIFNQVMEGGTVPKSWQ